METLLPKIKKYLTITLIILVIISFILMITSSLKNTPTRTQNQSNTTNIKSSSKIETPAFKLALLESGNNNPPQSLINDFDNLLNKLSIKCPTENIEAIAGYIFIAREKIQEGLGPFTLLETGNGINNSIPEEAIGISTCSEVIAMFTALMLSK